MFKSIWKGIFKGSVMRGVLRGIGGAALAGVGWKVGADLYDLIKKRLSRETAPATEEETEVEDNG